MDRATLMNATDLFNYLTGYSKKDSYRKLLVAPINLRARMEELIYREINIQKEGGEGQLIFKMNSLVDKRMIRLLYEASQTGVKIHLIVRGICCLRPGVAGLSENIQVISVVGRFLEHSRIYYFQNGGEEQVYMGSADLMPRNLNRRVEVLYPVEDPRMIRYIRDEALDYMLQDNIKSRLMLPDGSYTRVEQDKDGPPLNSQEVFIESRL